MNKKLVLFLIVCAEITLGSLFLSSYFLGKQNEAKVLGAAKVAKIDETKVVTHIDEELKYYWEYKPNEVVIDQPDWLDKAVTYSINNDGLNDTKNYDLQPPDGAFRIITLGDSFTFGHYVETKENWPEILEEKLKETKLDCYSQIEVINLGMPGFDVREIVTRYKRIGQKYAPDLVVWFESGSGFYRFNEVMQPRISECVGSWAGKNESGEATFQQVQSCWNDASQYVIQNISDEARSEMLNTALANFFSLVEINQAIFVYNDDVREYGTDFVNNFQQKFPGFRSFFPTLALYEPQAHLLDGHPSPVGHERIADQVHKILIDNNFICDGD